MPYRSESGRYERARRLGHVPIVESEFVRSRLRTYRVFPQVDAGPVATNLLVPIGSGDAPRPGPRWAFSFDGSTQEVATDARYPSTRLGYVQIAGVLVDLTHLLGEGAQRFVDPASIRDSTSRSLLGVVLPGSNVCRADAQTVRDSCRAEIFDFFREYAIEGQTILTMLAQLLRGGDRVGTAGNPLLQKCSADESCPASNIEVPLDGGVCPICGGHLYPTDVLRIHEEVQELAANATALGRLMTTLEHLTMLCYVGFLLERQPRILASVAFFIDGPLALFGPPAPIKRSVEGYLVSVAHRLRSSNLGLPAIVGVEKTGQFAEHAAEIEPHIAPRTLVRLPDDYIFRHVIATRARAASGFGSDTYYGRKFFYKSATGQMLTITVPCFSTELRPDLARDDPSWYETLPQTLALLDEVGTRLYQDALIPVALAHSYAAIPLQTGSKVLTLLSKELLGRA